MIRPGLLTVIVLVAAPAAGGAAQARDPLDPKGEVHLPIGIADSLDSLKTFVEAEGSFSPGFATYGIYFWLYDRVEKRLIAPTMDGVRCERGLADGGYLIPWSRWKAGPGSVTTEVCQAKLVSPAGDVQVVAARVRVSGGKQTRPVAVYVALRPLGAAGGPVGELAVGPGGDALLVDGHPALVAEKPASAAGVMPEDKIGRLAVAGKMPGETAARSDSGDCSGALRFDLELRPGRTETLGLICPVLPGRRAARHEWDGSSDWAQLDLARPNPPRGGLLQPDPGMQFYRGLKADAVFDRATAYWKNLSGRVTLRLPDRRWADCFAAVIGHAAMELNEGAADVAVVNYNVFNRDGVYVANILQKSGNIELAARTVDYFLAQPFNGRTQVEADNPGQVLWVLGQHWLFTRDANWLRRVYPAAAKLARMVRYYRTTPGPHYVKADSLEFGDSLPPDRPQEKPARRRQVLRPGSCDGDHPEYTEAFDVAGLRAAAMLARAAGRTDDAAECSALAAGLMRSYDKRFGDRLAAGYGDYCVLWPCRLYPCLTGKAHDQFHGHGPTKPGGWRYFALAKAHQGLLVGNRRAGCGTLANHLGHPQMRGWYVLDEGGRSGSGGWRFARTGWNGDVAMPHGWAIAEMWLLLRDCLVMEIDQRLHLLGGVPVEWFVAEEGIVVEDLPTHFGSFSLDYQPTGGGARLTLSGNASPPKGLVLAMPRSLPVRAEIDGREIARLPGGGFPLPPKTTQVRLKWPE